MAVTEAGQVVTFYFDPGCPWTWLTSRWLVAAAQERDLDVRWRTFSLGLLNEGRPLPAFLETPEQRTKMALAARALRVTQAALAQDDNDAAGRFYGQWGVRFHEGGREATTALLEEAAAAAGVSDLLPADDSADLDAAVRRHPRRCGGRDRAERQENIAHPGRPTVPPPSACRATPTSSPSSGAATGRSASTAPTTPPASAKPPRTAASGCRTTWSSGWPAPSPSGRPSWSWNDPGRAGCDRRRRALVVATGPGDPGLRPSSTRPPAATVTPKPTSVRQAATALATTTSTTAPKPTRPIPTTTTSVKLPAVGR